MPSPLRVAVPLARSTSMSASVVVTSKVRLAPVSRWLDTTRSGRLTPSAPAISASSSASVIQVSQSRSSRAVIVPVIAARPADFDGSSPTS